MTAVIKPPRLRKGDLIGLVAPASTPGTTERIEGSVRYLEATGFQVIVGASIQKQFGYLAGPDEDRAADFNSMIRDPRVRAIFALRGGYGCSRILDRIDYATLRKHPKIVSGFSDITALQLAIFRRCGLVSFSGPMPAVEFWDNPDPFTEGNFWPLLTSSRVRKLRNPPDVPVRVLRDGKAEGVLLGGNLAVLAGTIGTRFCPSFHESVLVLEDVDEAPYRLDRMLMQVRNTGTRPAAIIFGQFTRCHPRKEPSLTVDDIIQDFAGNWPVPAIANLQYGHVPLKLTIPFGVRARLDAGHGTIQLLESAVE